MKLLAVPVPLFNSEMGVDAYCFRFQKGDSFTAGSTHLIFDGAMDSPLLGIISEVGLEALTTGKPIFVPVSHISLLVNLEEQCKEDPHKIVFILDKNITTDDTYKDRILRYKGLGYRFACYSKMNYTYHAPIIAMCDYIFVDIRATDVRQARMYLKSLNRNITIIVSDIESADMFSTVRYDNFKLFEGPFYRLPLTKGQNMVSPLKINYIQLINLVRTDDFDIERVSEIVQRDAALAISLLTMVNSLGLREKIKSIKHAAAILGQKELRKWITTATTKMLAEDKPNEITKLSLVRAKFAENLAPIFNMAVNAQSLFLMGLFSALDIILDISMENALEIIQVSDGIKNALLYQQGKYYSVLEFILYYETADWVNVSRCMIMNNIDQEEAFSAYFDALSWYGSTISMGNELEAES